MADSRSAFAAVSVEKVSVEGTVQSVVVEDDDRAIDKVSLVMDDPHDDKREVFREGLRVQVDLGWGKDHAVLFEGVIVSTKPVSQGGVTRWRQTLPWSDLVLCCQPSSEARPHGQTSRRVAGQRLDSPHHGFPTGLVLSLTRQAQC